MPTKWNNPQTWTQPINSPGPHPPTYHIPITFSPSTLRLTHRTNTHIITRITFHIHNLRTETANRLILHHNGVPHPVINDFLRQQTYRVEEDWKAGRDPPPGTVVETFERFYLCEEDFWREFEDQRTMESHGVGQGVIEEVLARRRVKAFEVVGVRYESLQAWGKDQRGEREAVRLMGGLGIC